MKLQKTKENWCERFGLTWPVASGGACSVGAGLADGPEHGLPAAGRVAPVLRLQDERALGAVRDHEAIDHVVQLAAIATAFVDVTHKFLSFAAILRVL